MTYTVIRRILVNGTWKERNTTLADNVVEASPSLMALVRKRQLEKVPTIPLTMKPYPPSVGVERYEETHPRSTTDNSAYRQVAAPVDEAPDGVGGGGFAASPEQDARAAAPAAEAVQATERPAPTPTAARARARR